MQAEIRSAADLEVGSPT